MKRKALIATLVTAILLSIQTYQYFLLKELILKEFINREKIKASFASHHIEEYFQNLKKELTLISRLDSVKNMDKAAEGIVWKIALNNIEKDWLTEIYITDKNYDGFQQPYMVFELEGEKLDMTKDEYYALERELEEYAVVSNWRDSFQKRKSDFLLSKEINLCVDYRGFVASVPIYKDEDFIGQVSGMFSKKQLFKIINRDIQPDSTALLIDNEGDIILEESSQSYSESPDGTFKEGPSFNRIWRNMMEGEGGSANFEFSSKGKGEMFIYYMPINWDKNRWYLGIITPKDKLIELSRDRGIQKYQLGFLLVVLVYLSIGMYIVLKKIKTVTL